MKGELEAIMRRAGEVILRAHDIEQGVSEKEGPANFVTKYDVAVQNMLRESLLQLRPSAHFIGEEQGATGDALHGEAFIVDPIDGTTNFIMHYCRSAISVGLARAGEVVVGAVYNPYQNDFYYAEAGAGAVCNDRPIHVADRGLEGSLICMGTSPYYPSCFPRTFAIAERLLDTALDLRRSGSAVIDLCDVARGRAGLLFELRMSPWDYAAASLIVREAGGRISQLDGTPLALDHPCSVLAAAPRAYEEFFEKGLDRL